MPRRAISVTLETDNVTWLKGRAGAAGESVSELVDQLVTTARKSGGIGPARSVVGTIDVDSSDPLLEHADAVVRSTFEASLARPLGVHGGRAKYETAPKHPRKRRA